jgi:hypothetical protein
MSIDSFVYYGTDDHYLNYLTRFVKPGGAIGIAGAGLMREIQGAVRIICGNGGSPACGVCIRRRGGNGIGSGRGS